MMVEFIESLLFTSLRAGTPLLLIALGALISERSGVLNLGQEGMVLMGAACAFVASAATGSVWLGCMVGAVSGMATASLFAALVLGLRSNQVAAGLALTIFGAGLAAFIGSGSVGESIEGMGPVTIPALSQLPVLGSSLFAQDPLVYLSVLLLLATWFVLERTRAGLVLTATGHNPRAAHQLGWPVVRIRLMAIVAGGAFAGLAGAYLAVAYTPLWSEGISAGRGWIALALVVFAGWQVFRLAIGAYLFGLASIMHLLLQGLGVEISPNLLALLPYVATIVALLVISATRYGTGVRPPQSLGEPYHSGE